MWTDEAMAESYLSQHSIDYDKVVRADIDRFVTYELDDLFDEGDEILVNVNNEENGQLVDVIKMTDELMSELDDIRIKEFVKDVAKYDEVYGLTNKMKNFVMISDDEHQNLILCRFGVLKIVRLRYEMKILRNVKLSKLKVKFWRVVR